MAEEKENLKKSLIELLKKQEGYFRGTDSFYLVRGNPGYGNAVFEAEMGEVRIQILRRDMEKLVEQAIDEGKGKLEIMTNVSDTLGSPGYPDYMSWENNVKNYVGKAIISLEIGEKIVFSYELPEHSSHPWSGW